MPDEEEQRKITLDHMIDEKFGEIFFLAKDEYDIKSNTEEEQKLAAAVAAGWAASYLYDNPLIPMAELSKMASELERGIIDNGVYVGNTDQSVESAIKEIEPLIDDIVATMAEDSTEAYEEYEYEEDWDPDMHKRDAERTRERHGRAQVKRMGGDWDADYSYLRTPQER